MSRQIKAWNDIEFCDIITASFLPGTQYWRKITYRCQSYFISYHGNCYSMAKQRLLKCNYRLINGQVYGQYSFMGQWFSAHRLVLLAFGPPQPSLDHEPNHKDRNGRNNHIDNLEWNTHQENMIHAVANGKYNASGDQHWTRRLGVSEETKRKLSLSKQGEKHPRFKGYYIVMGNKYTSTHAASKATGIEQKTIYRRCKSNKRPTIGFSFEPL